MLQEGAILISQQGQCGNTKRILNDYYCPKPYCYAKYSSPSSTTNRIILYFYYEFIPSFTLRKKKGTSSLWAVKGNESDYMIQMMKRDTGNMERQYHMDPSRGLRKEFLPIINLGVWLNNTPYYAVQSINERICSTALETVGNLINDYRTNILIPALTDDSIFRSMKTEYRELFLYIKHQSDPDVLIKMAENGDFRPLQGEIIEAVNLITGSQLPVPKKGEVIDMCRGFDIIQQRAKERGLQEGITLGRMKGTYQILLKELKLGLLKMEDVLMLTGDTQEEFQKKMQMLFPEETLPASY